MNKRSPIVGALGAIAAVAALGTALPATSSPAQASTLACAVPIGVFPAPDPIRIETVGYDFGDGGLDSSNAPVGCGTVSWDLGNGTITPRLTGTLYAKNGIGTEIRMRLRHFDVDGTLLQTTNGSTKQVLTDDVEEFPIVLGNYSNPLTYRVDVELQLWDGTEWDTRGTQSANIASATKAADAVRILSNGKDFGTAPFVNGAPSGSGTLTWDLANNTITPRLTGNLYLLNSTGTRVRMQMKHYDIHGNRLITAAGATHQPTSDALQTIPINLANYSNPEIYKVEVSLTVDVFGTWTPVGNTVTVTI